ncbi:MAG: response regulator [Burkholderiales bacterium]|nr:response regulator [Burkholderiales bacterium]
MVGLMVFGEAAWSIEQVMNLWLSDSRNGDENLYALLERTAREMVEWVGELKQNGVSSRTGKAIIAAAERVKAGEDYQDIPEVVAAPVVEPVLVAPVIEEVEAAALPEALEIEAVATPVVEEATAEVLAPVTANASSEFDAFEFTPVELVDAEAPAVAEVPAVSEPVNVPEPVAEVIAVAPVFASLPELTLDIPVQAQEVVLPETSLPLDLALEVAVAAEDMPVPEAEELVADLPLEAVHEAILVPSALTEETPLEVLTETVADIPTQELPEAIELTMLADTELPVAVAESVEASTDSLIADLTTADELPEAVMPVEIAASEEAAKARETAEIATAKIIDFPDLSAPAPSVDDNIKRIGDIEISLPLYSIYMAETDEIVRFLVQDFAEWRHEPHRHVSTHAIHASHSLAGSSATVGLKPLQELAHSLEFVLQRLERHPVVLLESEYDVLDRSLDSAKRMLQKFALSEMAASAPEEIRQLEHLLQVVIERSNAGADEEFITSTNEKLDPISLSEELPAIEVSELTEAIDVTEIPVVTETLSEAEFNLDHAEVLEALPVLDEELAEELTAEELAVETPLEAEIVIAAGLPEPEAPEETITDRIGSIMLDAMDDIHPVDAHTELAPVTEQAPVIEPDPVVELAPVDVPEPVGEPEIVEAVATPATPAALITPASFTPAVQAAAEYVAPTSDGSVQIRDDLDMDLLPVFIEEGNDLLPMVGQLLRTWQEKPDDMAAPQAIARIMHTIKGSARMAGAMGLGQHIHDMESRIETLMHGGSAVRVSLLDDLLARHDHSMHMFDRLLHPEAHVTPAQADAPLSAAQELDQFQEHMAATNTDAPVVINELVNLTPVVPLMTRAIPARAAAAPVAVAANTPATLVRVRADILDRLVNQAGEVSISRSRLENEVSTLRSSLSELTENVNRLRDQLREVEIQAETQITSRMAHSGDREFDPLEFDRFTRLQELTRMMAESVSDVATVQTNLTRTIDGATNDLLVQARLTRDLQQDLMRVRMIPFASISERLYRVTRQTSKEVDKRVNLDIRGATVEMDRGVLEKMAGPFEHLLRNAIVHGIESREQRRNHGKEETGELLIEIRQEGNEVVIRFSDDGQGLNLTRIREKALSVGLISNEDNPGELETANMIFEPGFSTATEITELAGRGVGMDVVRSEAASLGGRVEVTTNEGKGAEFTIRLPLTLAVTQVVLLSSGGRTFAVPSVLVEQVQQLKSNALANAYNDGAVMWQGQRVTLYYLSSMLGQDDATPMTQQYSPLLIMKSGGERVAIHVDDVLGNREVVVKNIGPQLARMTGIAGATVLGSGEIVLILNPVPLAQRMEHEHARLQQLGAEATPEMGAVANLHSATEVTETKAQPVQGLRTQHTVMVVDDSLTVRRVTQRLLTREGYQVILAKDGIDALEQLQSVTPDVMLVDIEMPRMDGFDLTRNVRSDSRTSHIPIIMITSRTADKHRNYAKELGVNEYFGKPYREDDLLGAIMGFLGKDAAVIV